MNALILGIPNSEAANPREIPDKFAIMIAALAKGGIFARYFNPTNKTELFQILSENPADLVFSSAYGISDEHGKNHIIHEILEDLGLAYIGSGAYTLGLALNKARLKMAWKKNQVHTPTWIYLENRDFRIGTLEAKLNTFSAFPCIVKPARSGNSRGIDITSVAENAEELRMKVVEILPEFGCILVEEYLGTAEDFQEITVGWIGNGPSGLILPAEITMQLEKEFPVISTLDKEAHLTRVQQLEENAQWGEVVDFSRKAFSVINVRDYARLDIIRAGGRYYAIEINGQPMIPDRWFDACACGVGLNTTQYINAIFLSGIVRIMAQGNKVVKIPPKMHEVVPSKVFAVLKTPF
jgi:D-alanine-D-alanine ligase-like ATP-grasp enzyme